MITRRFAPDHLRPTITMDEDLRSHPVAELIRRRRQQGSRPGERSDGRRVALVIEGGGMRGVVSAGMTSAIEQLGLRDTFDEVHGSSAGAFNGAFLLAGQAGDAIIPVVTVTGLTLLWISAIVTLYTGYDYFRAGVRHLIE